MSAVQYQEVLEKARLLTAEEQRRLVEDLAVGQAAPLEGEELGPITRELAAMNLPVADVATMKREAQEGRWCSGSEPRD